MAILAAGYTGYFYYSHNRQSTPVVVGSLGHEIVMTQILVSWVPLSQSDGFYFQQNGRVYVQNPDLGAPQEIAVTDAATFMVLGPDVGSDLKYSYAKDKNYVYYRSRTSGDVSIISGADSNSFVVVANPTEYQAQDVYHKYWADAVICEDVTKATCVLEDGPGPTNGHWMQVAQ